MPRYDFRCRACGSTFELERPMQAAGDPAACPQGHEDTVKLLTTAGLGSGAEQTDAGGGCCGGGCCGG
ncbi:zinc ribbon domain-containing protein [Lipingzhangella sp. LS1_29]|uniref:Zinc ribbon domain-containing protein n=1 Tax=Lipingzhangella rawalii TaxID=2055835 RepID=A0ABU2H701_9ACTN|nr:zinc ribbon domain-containing protein [Lipingzhangella rawalii]MDS1271087.1 zinc ribbon domain-containing protein [Lipingzhangella rawalii]